MQEKGNCHGEEVKHAPSALADGTSSKKVLKATWLAFVDGKSADVRKSTQRRLRIRQGGTELPQKQAPTARRKWWHRPC